MFHITGFPQQPGVLTSKAAAPQDARLDIWPTDPASSHHISGPDACGAAFGTQGFSLINSGNRTLHAPKRSWKITLTRDADDLAGMTCINLKSMYNDPAQMREALAWRLLRNAGVPAARHTYAKARLRRDLLRPVLRYRAGRQEVPDGSLRRQPSRQPVQGLLRGRRMRHPGTPNRRRRR